MKFAFSSNAFLHHDLLETITILADLGYEGIEIMADVPHAYPLHLRDGDVDRIRRHLETKKIEISNINAFMHHADGDTYHPSWIEQDEKERRRRIEYTLACLDLAARLGAGTLSTEPGGPLEEGMSPEEGLRLFREGLAAVETRARQHGIRVLIEPEPGLLIENSEQFTDFYRGLNPDVFGINFDIGHFYCVGEDPAALVNSLKDATHHYHLEDIAASREHHHLMLGEGAIEIPRILQAIDGIGYEGFVTVELYTYAENAPEAARRALEYLRANAPGLR